MMDEKETRAFLRDEYLLLQNQYEDFDRRSLTIKGWVSTGAAAALAISFTKEVTAFSLASPIFVALIAVMFWLLEANWKLFQYALADRIRIIEAHFRDDAEILVKDPAPFQIYHYWFRSHAMDEPIYPWEHDSRPRSIRKRLWKAARLPFVMLPYAIIVLLSLTSIIVLALARR